MNVHVFMAAFFGRATECLRLLKCRTSYCLLSVVNYTTGLIIVSWLFEAYGDVLDVLYCIASCLFGIAITALYMNKPLLLVPDVIYKVTILLCALFFAIQEADTGVDGGGVRLALVAVAAVLQFAENYVLFLSLSAVQLEVQQLVQHRPPPPYDQLFIMELGLQAGLCTRGKLVVFKPVQAESTRPETPPPCYELAVENLRLAQLMYANTPCSEA